MNNVVDGVYYCQQNRTEELNERILERLNPNRLMQSQFSMRAVPTRYIRFPIIDSVNPSSEPIIRVPDYSVRNDFNPGNDKAPYNGFASQINTESKLRNQFFALQNCDANEYIPGSDSDLYNNKIAPENPAIVQKFPYLFEKPMFNSFDPNSCNLGNNFFNNNTRIDRQNLTL